MISKFAQISAAVSVFPVANADTYPFSYIREKSDTKRLFVFNALSGGKDALLAINLYISSIS